MSTPTHDLVSIVIPCYNQGPFLEEALRSLESQTYRPLEVIVVDDGSGPDTKASIRALQSRYVFELVTQDNGGLSHARNVGVQRARGRYILPLDADNYLSDDAVDRLVTTLGDARVRDPRIFYVYQDKVLFGIEERYVPHQPYNLYRLMEDNFADACSLLDRRIFDWGFRYNETMKKGYEDWEFHLRLGVYGIYGERLAGKTFLYRRWGYSMVNHADRQKHELLDKIRSECATLYLPGHIDQIKRTWAPGLTLITDDASPYQLQTYEDWVFDPPRPAHSWAARLQGARGKYILATLEDQPVTDTALLEKLLTVMEYHSDQHAIALANGDQVWAVLVRSALVTQEILPMGPQSAEDFWRMISSTTAVRWWNSKTQSFTSHNPSMIAGTRPQKRISRWVKSWGKRHVAPRIGFDNAYQTFYHAYQAVQSARRGLRRSHQSPPSVAPNPLSLQAAGEQLDQTFRQYTPVRFKHEPQLPMLAPPPALWFPESEPATDSPWVSSHRLRHTLPTTPSVPHWPPISHVDGPKAWVGMDMEQMAHILSALPDPQSWDIYEFSSPMLMTLNKSTDLNVKDLAFEPLPAHTYELVVVGRAVSGQSPFPALLQRVSHSLRAGGQLVLPADLGELAIHDGYEALDGTNPDWKLWRRTRQTILIVAPHLVQGGADRALVDLIRGLSSPNFEIIFVTTEPSPNDWIGLVLPYVSEYWDLGSMGSDDAERLALLTELVHRRAPDHAYIMHSRVGYDALPLFRQVRTTTWAQFHLEEPNGGWIGYASGRYQNLIDHYLVISAHLKQQIVRNFYVEPHKIDVVYLGVDMPQDVAPLCREERLQVLVPIRLDPQKAPQRLAAIASRLRDQKVPVTLHVLGNGPLRATIEATIREQHLEQELILHGVVAADQMPQWYHRSHAVLLTSDYEGLPLVLLEGMAHGRAVVAPNVGAIGEILDHQVGFLIDRADDITAYTEALSTLHNNPEQTAQMGLRGRARVLQQFDKRQTVDAYRTLFGATEAHSSLQGEPQ